ncbi:acetyltransferase domain-containing protein [Xylaria cf. heliscus]|nr:acetyltransferase domain-containing protein [Xylaria cf. heliscus]
MSSDGANATSVPVRTTLPRFPLPEQPTLRTERLLIRPLTQADLEGLYLLRSQAKYMAETSLGIPDADITGSQGEIDKLTAAPVEHFVFGIFLSGSGELIGDGGVHTIRGSGLGWPEIGYKIHPAHWGAGYATEAMAAVLEAWWALPREEAEVAVHPGALSQEKNKDGLARERVVAEFAAYNAGSKRVLEKLGFEDFGSWEEPDTQLHRIGQPLMLGHYVLSSPSS